MVDSTIGSQYKEEEETAVHFVCSCPASSDYKRMYLGKVYFKEEFAHLGLSRMFSDSRKPLNAVDERPLN